MTNLCWDDEKEAEIADFSSEKDKYSDPIMQIILEKHSKLLTKVMSVFPVLPLVP